MHPAPAELPGATDGTLKPSPHRTRQRCSGPVCDCPERLPARFVPSKPPPGDAPGGGFDGTKRAGTRSDGRKQGRNSADGCGEDRARRTHFRRSRVLALGHHSDRGHDVTCSGHQGHFNLKRRISSNRTSLVCVSSSLYASGRWRRTHVVCPETCLLSGSAHRIFVRTGHDLMEGPIYFSLALSHRQKDVSFHESRKGPSH